MSKFEKNFIHYTIFALQFHIVVITNILCTYVYKWYVSPSGVYLSGRPIVPTNRFPRTSWYKNPLVLQTTIIFQKNSPYQYYNYVIVINEIFGRALQNCYSNATYCVSNEKIRIIVCATHPVHVTLLQTETVFWFTCDIGIEQVQIVKRFTFTVLLSISQSNGRGC